MILADADLDIPSQRLMHARYRCDTLRHETFNTFKDKVRLV